MAWSSHGNSFSNFSSANNNPASYQEASYSTQQAFENDFGGDQTWQQQYDAQETWNDANMEEEEYYDDQNYNHYQNNRSSDDSSSGFQYQVIRRDRPPDYTEHATATAPTGRKSTVMVFESSSSSDDDDDDGQEQQCGAKGVAVGQNLNPYTPHRMKPTTPANSGCGRAKQSFAARPQVQQARWGFTASNQQHTQQQRQRLLDPNEILFWSLDVTPSTVVRDLQGFLAAAPLQVTSPKSYCYGTTPLSSSSSSMAEAPGLQLKNEFHVTVIYLGGGSKGRKNYLRGHGSSSTALNCPPGCCPRALHFLQTNRILRPPPAQQQLVAPSRGQNGEEEDWYVVRIDTILRTIRLAVAGVTVLDDPSLNLNDRQFDSTDGSGAQCSSTMSYLQKKFGCHTPHITLGLAPGVPPVEAGVRLREYHSTIANRAQRGGMSGFRREVNDIVEVLNFQELIQRSTQQQSQGGSSAGSNLLEQFPPVHTWTADTESAFLCSCYNSGPAGTGMVLPFPYFWTRLTAH